MPIINIIVLGFYISMFTDLRADPSRCAARAPHAGGQNKRRPQAAYSSINQAKLFKTYNKSNKYADF